MGQLAKPVLNADYQKNQPTRKLTQAAGKDEGDANIFPSMQLQVQSIATHYSSLLYMCCDCRQGGWQKDE